MTALATTAVVSAIFVGYYFVAKGLLLRLARYCATRTTSWGRRRSTMEITALYEIAFVVASHVIVVTALLLWQGVGPLGLGVTARTLVLLPFGVMLGIAQMVTSIFVCQVVIVGIGAVRSSRRTRELLHLGPATGPAVSPQAWTDYSRAGWMRHHLVAGSAAPRAVSMPLTTVQVACEEIVFRGVFPMMIAATAGPGLGLWVSGLLFVIMQAFFMPRWQSAMFPVVGATLMAASHGYLFATIGEMWPLVVAHAVSFFAAADQSR
jgi:hypothetical protein